MELVAVVVHSVLELEAVRPAEPVTRACKTFPDDCTFYAKYVLVRKLADFWIGWLAEHARTASVASGGRWPSGANWSATGGKAPGDSRASAGSVGTRS